MTVDLQGWMLLALACFGAGLLDAVAGGGGLLSLPAFFATGMPVPFALGTNKLVAAHATTAATVRYARAGLVPRRSALLALLSFAGGALGAWLASQTPEKTMRLAVLILLPAALAAVLWRQMRPPAVGPVRRHWPIWLWPAALGLGFYDGFFGPGTGTFLIAALVSAGATLEEGTGAAKPMNLGSNLGALAVFAWRGTVAGWLGFSLVPFMVSGAWVGASMAVKRGAPLIRVFLIVAVLAVCAHQAWKLVCG